MKFKISIGGKNYLLTAEQANTLSAMLATSEYLDEKWVGAGKGAYGSDKNYDLIVTPTDPASVVQLTAVTDEYIESIRLSNKLTGNF